MSKPVMRCLSKYHLTPIAALCSLAPFVFALFLPTVSVGQLDLSPRPGESLPGETPSSAGAADQQGMSPEKRFRKMLHDIKAGESEINRLYSVMPIGFPEKQKNFIAQIKELEANVKKLKAARSDAALESFKSAPMQDQVALQFVLQSLSEMMDPTLPESTFNPTNALEVIDLLLKNGAESNPGILYTGFRANVAIEDFAKSQTMLDRIGEVAPDFDLTQIQDFQDETAEKWQRELMIRRLEKNNNDLPKVKFETTAGDFVVVLYENHAPNAVANMVSLVEKKFYDDLTFYYVKPGEYVQTGCPNNDGTGDPGYHIASEFDRPQIRHYFSGTLGMANTGPNTEGSQFVITHKPLSQLDGRFTAFGRVVEGMDVVLNMKAISPGGLLPDNGIEQEPIKIKRATVVRKRDHVYEPERVAQPESPLPDLDGISGGDSGGSVFDQTSAGSSSDIPPVDGGGIFSPSQP